MSRNSLPVILFVAFPQIQQQTERHQPHVILAEMKVGKAVIKKPGIMSPVKTSALAVAGTKPAEDYHIHTVVHGDTLWAIAKKYLGNGSRYKEIVSLNGLKSNVIYSGMKLKIPNK